MGLVSCQCIQPYRDTPFVPVSDIVLTAVKLFSDVSYMIAVMYAFQAIEKDFIALAVAYLHDGSVIKGINSKLDPGISFVSRTNH